VVQHHQITFEVQMMLIRYLLHQSLLLVHDGWMTIEELDLSVRSYNCLKRAGINTVLELANKSRIRV